MKLRVPFKMLLRPAPAFRLGEQNAALLVMEVQRFTTMPDEGLGLIARERGILREFDEYYCQVEAAVRNLAVLVPACRTHGLRVIYTMLASRTRDRSDLSRQLRLSGLPIPTSEQDAAIHPEVAPAPGDLVLPRVTYSPFVDDRLLTFLQEARIDTLVLAGMLANVAVSQTALEAADRGLGVIVVWDASASETLGWHDNIKTGLVGPLIRVRTTNQVIEMLEGIRT